MRKLSTIKGKEIYDFTLTVIKSFTLSIFIIFCLCWLLDTPFTQRTSLAAFIITFLYDLGKLLSTEGK